MQQRSCRVAGQTSPNAAQKPRAPSPTASLGGIARLVGAGDSILDGGAGNDSISGDYAAVSAGAGDDVIRGRSNAGAVSGLIDGGADYDTFELEGGNVVGVNRLRNIEEFRLGENGSVLIALPDEVVAAGATLKVVGNVLEMFYFFGVM